MAVQSYDLIVLGDDLAGLIAASICAARGLRVLIAHPEDSCESYRYGGETLPTRSFVFTSSKSPAFLRVVEELNFQHQIKRKLSPSPRPLQLLGPEYRLDFSADPDGLAQALERESIAPATWLLAAQQLQSQWSESFTHDTCFPPTGFWERRELGKTNSLSAAAAQEWKEADLTKVEQQLSDLISIGSAGAIASDPLSQARHIALLQQGSSCIAGGWKGWRALFTEKFKSHNGEIRHVIPQSLQTSWGKVAGLKGIEDEYTCSYMIVASPRDTLLPLLDEKLLKKSSQWPPVTAKAFVYTLNLIVKREGVPAALSELACSLQNGDLAPLGGNAMQISLSRAKNTAHCIVTLEGLAPADDEGTPVLKGMKAGLLDHARSVMPFLDPHIIAIDSPHEKPAKNAKRDLGSLLPLRPIWDSPVHEAIGMQSLPYQIGLKRLCLANSQILPGLGMEGQCIAGWSAAKLCCASIGKKKTNTKTTVLSGTS